MDFKTASTIAQEQDLFLTTENWYQTAEQDARRVPGMAVHVNAYKYINGEWKSGSNELPQAYKKKNNWRVCAKETLVFNGQHIQ